MFIVMHPFIDTDYLKKFQLIGHSYSPLCQPITTHTPTGTKFLFQIAIQILQYNQAALLEVHDDGEAMQLLTEFTESICNKDSPLQIQVWRYY